MDSYYYGDLYGRGGSIYSSPYSSSASSAADDAALGGLLGFLAGIGIVMWIFIITLAILQIIGTWKIFSKAGHKGWECLVPWHHEFVLFEISGIETAWVLLEVFFSPSLIVFWFIKNIKLAHSFGKSTGFGIGLSLLPYIFYPILGFGNANYIGNNNNESQNQTVNYNTQNTNYQNQVNPNYNTYTNPNINSNANHYTNQNTNSNINNFANPNINTNTSIEQNSNSSQDPNTTNFNNNNSNNQLNS